MVPTMVPRGAHYGAIRLASQTYQSASLCTEPDAATGDGVASCGQNTVKNRVGPEGFEPPTKGL